MIVLTCIAVPNRGSRQESVQAARELMKQSQGHHGLLGYLWTEQDGEDALTLVEVHEDETSLLNHMEHSDTSRLLGCSKLGNIHLFGDTPSAALLDKLATFGDYTLHATL